LNIIYGGLGIGKLQFLIKKKFNFFSAVIFFRFLVIKALDPDWIRIRIGIQPKMPKMLDPDEINADPQPCSKTRPNKIYRGKQMVNKGGGKCIKRAKPYIAKKVGSGSKENVPDSNPT
jgi:hypothetical protein